MNASIKIISEIRKIAKSGKVYKEIWCEITVDDLVVVRKFIKFL